MTEQNHHDPAALDKLAEPFTVLPNDNPASDAKRQELIDKPAFGQIFSDNMAHISWTKGEGVERPPHRAVCAAQARSGRFGAALCAGDLRGA